MIDASVELALRSPWRAVSALRFNTWRALADLAFRRWLGSHHIPYETFVLQPVTFPGYAHPVLQGRICSVSPSLRTALRRSALWTNPQDLPQHPFTIMVDMPAIRRLVHICIILSTSHSSDAATKAADSDSSSCWVTPIELRQPSSSHVGDLCIRYTGRSPLLANLYTRHGPCHLVPQTHLLCPDTCTYIPVGSYPIALRAHRQPEGRLQFLRDDRSLAVISSSAWRHVYPSAKEAFFAGWIQQRDVLQRAVCTRLERQRGLRCTVKIPLSHLNSPQALVGKPRQGWG